MFKLGVVIVSTRPGRVGLPIGRWFFDQAKRHGKFDVQLVDLKEQNLPLLDEPKHPRLGQYEHEHTRRWSAVVSSLDAFVFVTPEYNYSVPATLINAVDFLFKEWMYKPAGFVSYGGQSGGTRSVQMSKLLLTSLKVVPLPEAVNIAFFNKLMKEDGTFQGNDVHEQASVTMLDELLRWTEALRPLR